MKKLIVLSVVFALVASAAFAVDLGGTVIGTVKLFSGESGDGANEDIMGSGSMNRIRIEGGGEAGEGQFGGYYRLNGVDFSGNAWWKPIDQFKLLIGSNGGDGFYGKEGVTGWMFYQTVADTDVVNPGNTWGGGYSQWPAVFRSAFYGGDGGNDALRLEIKPIDMLGINVVLPYFPGDKTEEVFKNVTAQLDVNLDFGNIALTYKAVPDAGNVFIYYGGSFGDLALDFGFGYDMTEGAPMGIGLGLKYATDAFGIKFRGLANLGGDDNPTNIVVDLLPFFPLGDNLTAFVGLGIAMNMPDGGDTLMDWHFNPYLQIGEEWGAKFIVGVRAWSEGGSDGLIKWEVPIAIIVGF